MEQLLEVRVGIRGGQPGIRQGHHFIPDLQVARVGFRIETRGDDVKVFLFSAEIIGSETFVRFLDRIGIAHVTVSHPALFTVEQSQALRGKVPGAHSKNLFLRDKKGALFLVSAIEDAAIELKSLHRRLGAGGRFSFGSAELMADTLGVEPGAVTPFGAMNMLIECGLPVVVRPPELPAP